MEKIAQEVAEQELSRLEEFREFEPRDLEGYEPIRELLVKRIMHGDLQIDEQYNPIVTFRFTNKLREAEGKTALQPQIIKFYTQSNARKLYKQNGAADPATMAACMKDFLPNMIKQVDNKDLNLIEVIILFFSRELEPVEVIDSNTLSLVKINIIDAYYVMLHTCCLAYNTLPHPLSLSELRDAYLFIRDAKLKELKEIDNAQRAANKNSI